MNFPNCDEMKNLQVRKLLIIYIIVLNVQELFIKRSCLASANNIIRPPTQFILQHAHEID